MEDFDEHAHFHRDILQYILVTNGDMYEIDDLWVIGLSCDGIYHKFVTRGDIPAQCSTIRECGDKFIELSKSMKQSLTRPLKPNEKLVFRILNERTLELYTLADKPDWGCYVSFKKLNKLELIERLRVRSGNPTWNLNIDDVYGKWRVIGCHNYLPYNTVEETVDSMLNEGFTARYLQDKDQYHFRICPCVSGIEIRIMTPV